VTVAVHACTGLLEGESREVVYIPVFPAGRQTLSELTWDLAGLAMLGVGVEAGIGNRWLIGADYHRAVNRGYGEMNDFDWLGQGPDWTDWSRSVAIVEAGEMFDARAAAVLAKPFDVVECRVVAGYRRLYWRWTDRGQEYVYSVVDSRDTSGSFMGARLVDYRQEFSIPYLGCGLAAKTGPVRLDAAVLYSNMVRARDWDYHHVRSIHFEERFSGGQFVGVKASAGWTMRPHMHLTLALDGQSIPEIVGDMTIVEQQITVPNTAGISHQAVMGTVGVTYVF